MKTGYYWTLRKEGDICEYLLIDRFLFFARRFTGEGQLILTHEWADFDDAYERAISSTERVEAEGLTLYGAVRAYDTPCSEEYLMKICDDHDGMAAVKMMSLADTYGESADVIAFTWQVCTERNGIDFSTRFILMDRAVITLEEDDDLGTPNVQVRDFSDAAAARDYAIRQTASFEAAKWEFTGSVMMRHVDVDLENLLNLRYELEALGFVVNVVNQILQHGRELG